MITPRQAVLAEAATYAPGATPTWSGYGGAVSVFLTESGDELVVSIEGTHTDFGLALDFDAWPSEVKETVPHPSLPSMHRGFYDATFSVLDPVRAAVKGRKWTAVGHSLGGAVAQAIAAWLADEGNPPQAVYLFAPARVFTDAPDVLAGVPIFGWRCGGDLVPAVPPLFWRPLLTHFAGPSDPLACHHIGNFTDFIR
jgi:pimeloyl-ACP methyl ester carboxylesterase